MTNPIEYLTQIRKEQGIETLKNIFENLFQQNPSEAIEIVNDETIPFPWLYLALPMLKKLFLFEELNRRNITALKLCAQIQRNRRLQARVYTYSYENKHTYYPVLLWMFHSGIVEDGLDDDFDEIIDGVVSLLIHNYQETSILHEVCELMYERNRQGRYNHDLIWAYLRSNDIEALKHIAEHFHSKDPKDIKLTCKLLHCDVPDMNDAETYYEAFQNWLEENKPYLSFTDETLQETNEPHIFQIDINSKYLCRTGKEDRPFTENEMRHLIEFQNRSMDEQLLLSHFAYNLRKQSEEAYQRWMRFPVSQQIDIAKSSTREV